MGELMINNSTLPINRTVELIAAEINSIKQHTKNMVLYNSIEIGRRLAEAKALVEHGKWGDWLEQSVDYSQRTANNLMRIFEEYGAEQLTLLGNNANSQALANLSYTQAVALLGVPEEEREQFAKEHDIENMSTRELQEAIKERDQAKKEKEILEQKLQNIKANTDDVFIKNRKLIEEKQSLESELRTTDKVLRNTQKDFKILQESLQKERDRNKSEIERLNSLLNEARSNGSSDEKVRQLEKELQEAKDQVEKFTEEMNNPGEIAAAVIEKVPEDIEKELNELREKVRQQPNPAAIKFKVHFDDLVKNFQELLGALAEIKDIDEQAFDRYKNATAGLIGKMNERLV